MEAKQYRSWPECIQMQLVGVSTQLFTVSWTDNRLEMCAGTSHAAKQEYCHVAAYQHEVEIFAETQSRVC